LGTLVSILLIVVEPSYIICSAANCLVKDIYAFDSIDAGLLISPVASARATIVVIVISLQ
jgi:hypothetical protein